MAVVVAFAVATFVGLLALWFAARGAITVCVLAVAKGDVEIMEGKLAPRVLADVRDVVRRPRVGSATIRIVRAKERATVDARGDLNLDQMQQLRNIIGNVPLAKLVGGKKA